MFHADGEVATAKFKPGTGSALGVARVLGYANENAVLSAFGWYDDSIKLIQREIETGEAAW